MLKERHIRELLMATESEFAGTLFEDVMVGTVAEVIPERLEPYAHEITREQTRLEGHFLFLVWLLGEVDGVIVRMPDDRGMPCDSFGERDLWFPEWPDPRETTPEEFRAQFFAAELDSAQAKRLCGACEMRQLCLARSEGVGILQIEPHPEEFGIFGGWGPGARTGIAHEFDRKRRAFLRGQRDRAQGRCGDSKLSMSEDEMSRSLNTARKMAKRLSLAFPGSIEGSIHSPKSRPRQSDVAVGMAP